jgi:hypothetical protein
MAGHQMTAQQRGSCRAAAVAVMLQLRQAGQLMVMLLQAPAAAVIVAAAAALRCCHGS